MIFEKEINIYAPDAILKRFQAAETSVEVTRGKIEALISESELIELQNSKATMYSKMADIKFTVDGLTQSYSDVTAKYDTVTGQYSSLQGKVAEYKQGLDGLSANLSSVNTRLNNDYSTTEVMNAAISASIEGFSSTVSKTYATGAYVQKQLQATDTAAKGYANDAKTSAETTAKGYADNAKSSAETTAKSYTDAAKSAADTAAKGYADAARQEAIDTANADTKDLLKDYATVTSMQSAIDQAVDHITSTVSSTYATKEDLTGTEADISDLQTWKKEASQKITDSAIVSTVTSSIAWGRKANKAQLISQINQTAESVTIQASKISLEGLVTANNYFKINTDGSYESIKGKVGGWIIATNTLKSVDGSIILDSKNNRITTTADSKGNKTTIKAGVVATGDLETKELYAKGGQMQIGPYTTGYSYLRIRSPFETSNAGSGHVELCGIPTVKNGGHVVFDSDGTTLAYLGSSSKRYKNHIRDIGAEDLDNLYKLPTVMFVYKPGYLKEDNDIPIPGLYAEDVEKYLPLAARYQNGKVEDWAERMIIPYLIKALQEQHKEIEKLKAG